MSTPMPPLIFVERVQTAGCRVTQLPGWLTHNRNLVKPWNNVIGIVVHHTGSDTGDPVGYAKNILWYGYSGLPGPLCFGSPAADGSLVMVGNGRANHAGGGSPVVRDHVVAEDYNPATELDPYPYGNSNGTDGNSLFYGFEVQFSGGHPMTNAQYLTTVIACAVICIYHGWSEKSVIGHREWSNDKWDPGMTPMNIFRDHVRQMIAELRQYGGKRKPPTVITPPPFTPPAIPGTVSKPPVPMFNSFAQNGFASVLSSYFRR